MKSIVENQNKFCKQVIGEGTPKNYFTSSYPHHYERFMASAATNSRSSRSRGLVVEDVVVIVVVAVVDPVDV